MVNTQKVTETETPKLVKEEYSLRHTDSIQMMIASAFLAKRPLVLVGEPGTTKTAVINKLAEDLGYELVTVIGSRMAPTDVSGILHSAEVGKDQDGKSVEGTVSLIPDWQWKIASNPKSVLFYDEMSNTTPATQASMLNVIQDRVFPNGTKIPYETVIIAAMNPSSQAADGYDLPLPTTNRFVFMAWDPEPIMWYEGMRAAFGVEVTEDELKWKRLIVDFLEENEEFLHRLPGEGADYLEKSSGAGGRSEFTANDPVLATVSESAWPSRRSWDNLSKALAAGESMNNGKGISIPVQDNIIKGTVGFEAAISFRTYVNKHADKSFDMDAILKSPETIAKAPWIDMTEDQTNMIVREVIARFKNNKAPGTKAERWEKAVAVLRALIDAGRDDRAGAHMQAYQEAASTLSDRGKEKSGRMDFFAEMARMNGVIGAYNS